MRGTISSITAPALILVSFLSASAVTIDTVPVRNRGNANDPEGSGRGSVAYDFRIGTYEVTVGQYADFLNAVAATDTYALYDANMAIDSNISGISRDGSAGSYAYSAIGSPNKPVTYVSWGDAARFANWLHNGQPSGLQDASTTEDGAYSLSGAITRAALNAVSRNASAVWFLPSENEWYKAAYHKNDGATTNYWSYTTSTDTIPYSDQPPGSDAPIQSNTGNFYRDRFVDVGFNDGFAVTGSTSFNASQNYLTDVGAYTLSISAYGTYDQGGNVREWNESRYSNTRGTRGGEWSSDHTNQKSSTSNSPTFPENAGSNIGFRVAIIPEPSTLAMAGIGLLGAGLLRWRRER